ncbi:MAG: sigma-70 family RNA polymerase sigma factor [Planctomycetota bacterium]
MPESERIPIEQVLENGTWVRKLARRLLWDESLVDDVVQEAWILAFTKPPSKAQALQAWLKKVVRSLSFRANTKSRRRQEIAEEASTHSPPSPPSRPDDILEALDTQRQLMDFVRDLPNPYREVVFRHYFQDQKLVDIARELEIPSSTSRTYLQRGLDKLRERLSTEHGGRNAWMLLLLAVVIPKDLWATPVPSFDAAPEAAPEDATSLVWGAAATGALLICAAMAWIASVVTDPTQDAPKRLVAQPRVERSGVAGEPASPEPAKPATARADASKLVSPSKGLALPTTGAFAVFDRSTGDAIEHAQVFLAPRLNPRSTLIGESDSDGRVTVKAADFEREAFFFLAEGYRELRLEATSRKIDVLHVVELDAAPVARVSVVGPDGVARAGIPVDVVTRRRGSTEPQRERHSSNADGWIEFSAPYLSTTLVVDAAPYAELRRELELPKMTLELEEGFDVRGQIVAGDGSAIKRARIEVRSERQLRSRRRLHVDSGDAFPIARLGLGDEVTLRVFPESHPAFVVTRSLDDSELKDGENPLVWSLEAPTGVLVRGQVSDPAGDALVSGFAFLLTPRSLETSPKSISRVDNPDQRRKVPGGRRRWKSLDRAMIGSDGTFEFRPLALSDDPLYLLIHHSGYAAHLERLHSSVDSTRVSRQIRLREGWHLSGRAVLPSGRPAAGVRLHVGEMWSNGIEGVVRHVRADDDGRFSLRSLPTTESETLLGDRDAEGREITRRELFLAAFSPDEVLRLDDEPSDDLYGTLTIPIASSLANREARVIVAPKKARRQIAIELRNSRDETIRQFTHVLLFDDEDQASSGTVGPHPRGVSFFTDTHVELPDSPRSALIVTRDYAWQSVPLSHGLDSELRVQLNDRIPESRLQIVSAAGTPRAGAAVWVAVPFDAVQPSGIVLLGRTDNRGFVDAGGLPDAHYDLYVSNDSADERRFRPVADVRRSDAIAVDLRSKTLVLEVATVARFATLRSTEGSEN